jgi:hypothetical protein
MSNHPLSYYQRRMDVINIEHNRSSPLRSRKKFASPEENIYPVRQGYIPEIPMHMRSDSPEYKRQDLTDTKSRINDRMEIDVKLVKSVGGGEFYDNDQAYLKFLANKKQELLQKPYLNVTD